MAACQQSESDEKTWLKLVETAVVALDMTFICDQTRANRAASEYHHMALKAVHQSIHFKTDSPRINGVRRTLQERFPAAFSPDSSEQFITCWEMPIDKGERRQGVLSPAEELALRAEIFTCGVELALRTEFVSRWEMFRTFDFKKTFPFALDIKNAKNIVRTILLINEGANRLSDLNCQWFKDGTMCEATLTKRLTEGGEMYLLGGSTLNINKIPEVFKVYESLDLLRNDVNKLLFGDVCHCSFCVQPTRKTI